MNTGAQIRKTLVWRATLAVAALMAVAPAPATSAPQLEPPTVSLLPASAVAFDSETLSAVGRRRLAAISWREHRYRVSGGETVDVKVSPAYASDENLAQRWADFFDSLVHGPELGLLTAYIAPLEEVQEICGKDALGCYGANRLVMAGDSSGGVALSSIAAHEYGHHVANNRLNPPWRAVDWGTKRWASYMNICARAAQGTAFPGDEGIAYALNPGEAFAEAYRVLNEREQGLPLMWPIVDPSFIPDDEALQALREDVVNPWSNDTTRTIRVHFSARRRVWTQNLTTPLDGQLSAAAGGSADIQLLGEGHRLVRASWTSGGGKLLAYQVCGRRSVELRVARGGGPRTVTIELSQP